MRLRERAVRFGVADQIARKRAATWKCWTAGGGKSDVYILCREVGQAIKLSLHESGQWHFAFAGRDLFDEGAVPPDRFLGKYQRAPALAPGITLACRIQTAATAVSVPVAELDSAVHWIARPAEGQAVEVAVFIVDGRHDPAGWPAKNSMGTLPAGSFELDDGNRVWVVHRTVAQKDLSIPLARGTLRFFRGKGPDDMAGADLRGFAWNRAADGSIFIIEGRALTGPDV